MAADMARRQQIQAENASKLDAECTFKPHVNANSARKAWGRSSAVRRPALPLNTHPHVVPPTDTCVHRGFLAPVARGLLRRWMW